ncbi:MAG: hypothetical protein ACT4P4_05860, partial [Betaproteobacteria bacterium]
PREDFEMKRPSWSDLGFAGLLAAMFAAGCATAPPTGAPRADGPVFAPSGASWVIALRDSGSFGSANEQRTVRARGEQTWQGRKVNAYEGQEGTLLIEVPTGKFVARVSGATPLESWDPPLGWKWPIWVGKSWSENFRFTNHQRGQTFNVLGWWKVEAHEDIKVPAGTFKVFRVNYSDEGTEIVSWWSPELGINVKSRTQRTGRHFAGPGTREVELVSHDIKR